MAPIIIYGNPMSTCTQRVIAVAKAKGLEYKVEGYNGKSDFSFIKDDKFIAEIQPFGQMPAIDDNGFTMFESRAICVYLASKYKSQGIDLMPEFDAVAMASFNQGANIEAFNFDKHASAIAYQMVFSPMYGGKTDEAAVKQDTEMLSKRLEGMDILLGKQKYLGGDQLTVVDIFALPYGTMVEQLGKGDGLKSNKNVARWWNEISNLDYWKFAAGEAKKAREAMGM